MRGSGDDLISEIKHALASMGTEPTPASIVEACCETIVELDSRGRREYKELLDIIEMFSSSIRLSRNFVKAVSAAINHHYCAVLSILRAYFKDRTVPIDQEARSEVKALFQMLIKHSEHKGVSNLVARHFSGCFDECSVEQKVGILKNSLEILGDCIDAIDFMVSNEVESNALILSYLEYNANGSISCEKLRKIVDLVTPESSENLKILTRVLMFHRQNMARSKVQGQGSTTLFSRKLFDLVRHEVMDAHAPKELEELVSMMSDMVLPGFSPLVREMNERFLSGAPFSGLLRNIASSMKIEEFIEIIQPIDIRMHYQVLRGISNVDLGVFVGLYKTFSKNTEFSQLDLDYARSETFCAVSSPGNALDCLMACLPSFCYYCSDYKDNVGNIIRILKAHLPTHRSFVCSAIERLVQSHLTNVSGTLHMGNPVERSESAHILDSIRQSGIFHELLQAFLESKSTECDTALGMVANLCHVDVSSWVVPVIMGDSHASISLYDSLRLMPFFIGGKVFEFDFISRLAELCCSAEVDIQKRAYYLLYCIYSATGTDACICDILYSSMERSVSLPSKKNRIMLCHAILKKGCRRCGVDHASTEKFLTELVKSAGVGNAKCRKAVRDIVNEMADDSVLREFMLTHTVKEIQDPSLLCGCIECAGFILDHMCNNQEYIASHGPDEQDNAFVRDLLAGLVSVSLYSQDVVKPILRIFTSSLETRACEAFIPEMLRVVDTYVLQFSKKFNRDLRNFCIAAEDAGCALTKAMKTLLRLRNKSGRPKEFLVVPRQEIGEMMWFSCTSK